MAAAAPRPTCNEIELPQGTIRCIDQGTGPTLVFLHGLLANSQLWSQFIPRLAPQFRCIAPDLPLGAHSLPLKQDADLSPLGVAQLVADLLAALDLHDVTLVGNDTGGAICQLVIAHHPARITRLVLTNCDAFEQFFPPLVSPFRYGARLFGIHFANFLAWTLRAHAVQRSFAASISRQRPEPAELAAMFHPVLLVWGKDDIFFSPRLAVRLQQAFPDATLTFLPNSRAFVPQDQPEALAQHIAEFVHAAITPSASGA